MQRTVFFAVRCCPRCGLPFLYVCFPTFTYTHTHTHTHNVCFPVYSPVWTTLFVHAHANVRLNGEGVAILPNYSIVHAVSPSMKLTSEILSTFEILRDLIQVHASAPNCRVQWCLCVCVCACAYVIIKNRQQHHDLLLTS